MNEKPTGSPYRRAKSATPTASGAGRRSEGLSDPTAARSTSRPVARRFATSGRPNPSPNSPVYRPKRLRAGAVPPKPRKQRQVAKIAAPAPAPKAPELSSGQRRHLRGLAHDLKPIIRLGNSGLTESVAAETARALHDHELIKVKAAGGADRGARDAMFVDLARRTASALIHRIGNTAVLYRPNPKLARIMIPDAPR